jgi:hypothetical protein
MAKNPFEPDLRQRVTMAMCGTDTFGHWPLQRDENGGFAPSSWSESLNRYRLAWDPDADRHDKSLICRDLSGCRVEA